MTAPEPLLDRTGIERAFQLLGDRLHRRGVIADVYVVGGAAMIRVLGLTTVEQVAQICTRVFPDEPLSDRARLLIEDALADLQEPGDGGP